MMIKALAIDVDLGQGPGVGWELFRRLRRPFEELGSYSDSVGFRKSLLKN